MTTSNQPAVEPETLSLEGRFLESMARVAAAVAVVTAISDDAPHGTTVSAFASLSVSPPMVLVSLDQRSDLLQVVTRTGRFGVNVLGAEQHQLARSFARKGHDKFEGVEWLLDSGLPRLSAATAWVACELAGQVTGGDHQILLGAVVDAEAGHLEQPLTYHRRTFGTHSPVDISVAGVR